MFCFCVHFRTKIVRYRSLVTRKYSYLWSMDKKGKILIIDDNEDVLFAMNILLSSHVEKIKVSTQPEKIAYFISEFQPDVIFLDMNFSRDVSSGQEGFMWLERVLKLDPQAVVVLMTAYADMDKAIQAIRAGATDFISKPWEKEKLLATLFSALKLKDSRQEVAGLKKQMEALNMTGADDLIIGESPAMQEVFSLIDKLSGTDVNMLILGENGTGKDLIARSICRHSPRADKAFVRIDLGTIPESIFESELFGYEKGAFTDAKREKPGRMDAASGGTLFLDEVANLSMSMQSKMLTAIEKKCISRLGSTKNIPIDVRFICATNADIYREVEAGNFRRDLLYRVNTVELHIPPLRERGQDIILLAEYFLRKYANKYKKAVKGLAPAARAKLLAYSWPGNVRELQNSVERAVILSSGNLLSANDLILQPRVNKQKENEVLNLETMEQHAITKAMEKADGNYTKAAELLGITRFALYRKMKKNVREGE